LMAGLVTGMLEQPAVSLLPRTSAEKPIFVPIREIEEQRNNHAKDARSNEARDEIEITEEIQTSSDILTTSAGSIVTTDSEARANAPAESCRVCGHPLRADEAFCGHCSMPRVAATPSDELQSKWASLWFIQKAQGTFSEEPEEPAFRQSESSPETVASWQTDSRSSGAPQVAAKVSDRASTADHFSYFKPTAEEYTATQIELLDHEELSFRETWSHAVEAARNKLRVRDVLLALVVAVLTFGVVSAWPSSSGKLTWFGSTMVRLGLAQAPTHSPVYGNPDANVWVDVHSGLYYCEGADLYGETPQGQFITQRKAQQRNFEPATGLACQ